MDARYRHYLMAFVLSVLVSISAFFIIKQIDTGQLAGLAKQVEQDSLDSESARLSLIFIESLEEGKKKDEACIALQERSSQQINQTYGLLQALEDATKTFFLADVKALRQKYFLSNAALYLDLKKMNSFCSQKNHLVFFFYNSEAPCPECDVQGKVLDALRADCPSVKTFAFPADNNLPLVELFKKTFNVNNTPFIVIDETTIFDRLVSEQELKQAVGC